jgi:hypothetical protein
VTEDTGRSYMNAWLPETTGKGKSQEEMRRDVVDGVLKIIGGEHNFSYATRVKGKRNGIVSMTYKCEQGEGTCLIELVRKSGMDLSGGSGGYEIRIDNVPDENEWVEAIKRCGYKKKKCLPARVKISPDGKFVTFFPDYEIMNALEKP